MNDLEGDWEDVEVLGPDVTDRQTLITLAKMTSNAYVLPDSGEWWPLEGWNATTPFGWEADADGLRGHVVSLWLSDQSQGTDNSLVRRC
jgi:lipase ATG15